MYALPSAWNIAGNITLQGNKTTFKLALRNQHFEELLTDNNP